MIDELASVVLTADLPERGLRAGDIGTVVMVHQQGAGYTVEFLTLGGETVAVVTLPADGVRPVRPDEIAHARGLAVA
ncbi:MAG: DUF4926 domain-containing protein [Chloroflexi bacterium]|nr:DUF4926 domain-containing protein [Chloroflexota bacterium]